MQAGLGEGSGDYALETSLDGIPDSWLDDRAELQRRMSTDVPLGDLQLEEEDWDAERMRGEYEVLSAMGRRVVETVARHVPSGRLVGYTQVQVSPERPTLGYQQDTLVVREHRGHGLGLSSRPPTPPPSWSTSPGSPPSARGTPTTTPTCSP